MQWQPAIYLFIFLPLCTCNNVAWRCDLNCMHSKDAHKQLAQTSLNSYYYLLQEGNLKKVKKGDVIASLHKLEVRIEDVTLE